MSIVCAGPMKWVQLDMVLTQDTKRGGGWCDAVIVAMTTCPVEHVNTVDVVCPMWSQGSAKGMHN